MGARPPRAGPTSPAPWSCRASTCRLAKWTPRVTVRSRYAATAPWGTRGAALGPRGASPPPPARSSRASRGWPARTRPRPRSASSAGAGRRVATTRALRATRGMPGARRAARTSTNARRVLAAAGGGCSPSRRAAHATPKPPAKTQRAPLSARRAPLVSEETGSLAASRRRPAQNQTEGATPCPTALTRPWGRRVGTALLRASPAPATLRAPISTAALTSHAL
mmetsp:Transcript_67024/g.212133  ORF Transcript_67024/g.212133 Transcript_67024/m.212133 type:complete len:223 (-) Transcript_67024:526-1194(-)